MNAAAEPTILIKAEESAGTVLLSALLDEYKQVAAWQSMPEHLQADVIERLRNRVETVVGGVVRTIACQGFGHIVAEVESMTIKDGAKAVVSCPRGTEEMHTLADRVGSPVVITFTDPREYTEGMGKIRAEADQRELPGLESEGGEATGGDADADAPPDAPPENLDGATGELLPDSPPAE